jgi:hypothetical protein
MAHAASRAYLAPKASEQFMSQRFAPSNGQGIVLSRQARDHLQGDDATHQNMFGFIDVPHAADAEAVDDAIGSQAQASCATCQHLPGLVARKDTRRK